MNSQLQTQFVAIETQRRLIVAQIEALSDEQRLWTANPTDWSALQIVEHLVLGDETVGSVAWAQRQLETSGAAPPVHLGRQKLILWALRRNIRLPLPSPDIFPRGETAWPELKIRWQAARNELRQHLEAPDFDANRRPFFHTIAGALSAGEMMEMSEVHNNYHARQLTRLIAAQPPRDGSR